MYALAPRTEQSLSQKSELYLYLPTKDLRGITLKPVDIFIQGADRQLGSSSVCTCTAAAKVVCNRVQNSQVYHLKIFESLISNRKISSSKAYLQRPLLAMTCSQLTKNVSKNVLESVFASRAVSPVASIAAQLNTSIGRT